MGQLAVEHPELLNEWDYEKNGDLRPEDVTSGSGKKVWWKCDKGHEWRATIHNRSNGQSCPVCSGKKVLVGYNDLSTVRPELAAQWHPTKNGKLTPHDVTSGSGKKVWWKCDKGHEWQATVNSRNSGQGCPICASKRVQVGYNDLATLNPKLASQWHPTKNGDLIPEGVTVSSKKKVWWKCDKGHEWQATVGERNAGNGCPFCSGRRAWAGYNDLATLNPKLASQWHPSKNDDLTPEGVTASSHKKVWWICDKGHEWQATVNSRSKGIGCPICSGRKVLVGYNDLATVNPDLAAQWHPTKNGDLTPEMVTIGSHKKVWWKCDRGHEWQAAIYDRSSGSGCPLCSGESKTSFPEQAIFYYLSLITPAKSRFMIDNKYEADIFLPELNVAIEYDGWFWHKNSEKQVKDKRKGAHIEKSGTRLIRVKEIVGKEQIPENTHDIIYCIPDRSRNFITVVIDGILQRLGIESNIDVNLKRDSAAIYNQYINSLKENSLLTLYPDIAAQWHPTKNGDFTPDMVTPGSTKKVWWICDQGHEWQAAIGSRTAGYNCPYCSGKKVLLGYNDLSTINPDLAVQWHPTKNGDLTPEMVTIGSHKKVWWKCDKGHEWQATIKNRNNGQMCPICSGRQVLAGYNDLATLNPKLASQWHPTKNGDLNPEMVSISSGEKVWWKCDKGHEWQARIADRSNGIGCPICSGRKVLVGYNDLATVNPEIAAQWHPTKNGKLTPHDVTSGSSKKVWWICDKGHEWQAAVSDRARGRGCPYCSGRRVWPGSNDLATVNPGLAAQWHPTKNGGLTPRDVTVSSNKKIWWKCEKGHEWQAAVSERNRGRGCPACWELKQKKNLG